MPVRHSSFATTAGLLVGMAVIAGTQVPAAGQQQGQIPPQILQRFDANGNGQLDPPEYQAAMQWWQQNQAGGGQGMGGQGGQGGPGGQGMGRRGMGAAGMGGQGMGQGMLSPQMQQQLLQKFDTNGNGQLDPNEQQAAQQYMQQQMQGGGGRNRGRGMGGQGMGGAGMGRPGMGGQGMGPPGMGQGMMNPQMQQQLLQKFDTNGNGQLDPNEQQAARQFMQQQMQGGQMGAGGPMGQGGQMGPAGLGMRPPMGQPGAAAQGADGQAAAGQAANGTGTANPPSQQQLLQRFDKNGNGKLDASEQKAAQKWWLQQQNGNAAGKKTS